MPSQPLVGGDYRRPEQCSELACRSATQEVHLKKPVLRMCVAGGEGQVTAIRSPNRWRAGGIAFDGCRRAELSNADLAIELRQARAQRRVERERDDDNEPQHGPSDDVG